MALTLTCSGAITVDTENRPQCATGWITTPQETGYMTVADFNDLAPQLMLLMVVAVGIRYVVQAVNAGYGRN